MTTASTIVRRARRAAGLTQSELARRLGVTQPVIARLERSGANPRLNTLDRVAAATGHALRLDLEAPMGIDESMIAADLALSPDERLRRFESFYEFARAAGSSVASGRGP
jgi:transcriptional regulator with XRE-family HTH domain